jgi:hypothetical protein
LGISVWTEVLLDKYLYARPTHRLLQQYASLGLPISQGTITDGLKALAPLFDPLIEALHEKQMSESLFFGDETRWMVFETVEGKSGRRWYLWVTLSASVCFYRVATTRATAVPHEHFATLSEEITCAILVCDRYSAYKCLAKEMPADERVSRLRGGFWGAAQAGLREQSLSPPRRAHQAGIFPPARSLVARWALSQRTDHGALPKLPPGLHDRVLKDGSLPTAWEEYRSLKHEQEQNRIQQNRGERRQLFECAWRTCSIHWPAFPRSWRGCSPSSGCRRRSALFATRSQLLGSIPKRSRSG